jgi:hypothetical protein
MRKIVKVPLIIFGAILVLFVGLVIWATVSSNDDPLKAQDISSADIEGFLNSSFQYWSGWGGNELNYSKTINEVFYSGKQTGNFTISSPKYLGKNGDASSIAIIIHENDKPADDANTIVYINYFNNGISSLDYITQLHNGSKTKLGDKLEEMTTALNQIYPDDFFSEYYKKWEELSAADTERMFENREKAAEEKREKERIEAEERAARITPEGWPKNSVYTSILILQIGRPDYYTVGQMFYTRETNEGVTVEKPRKSGSFYIITIKAAVDGGKSTANLYLRYADQAQESYLEKIEAIGADGKKTTLETFEEKAMVLMQLMPFWYKYES